MGLVLSCEKNRETGVVVGDRLVEIGLYNFKSNSVKVRISTKNGLSINRKSVFEKGEFKTKPRDWKRVSANALALLFSFEAGFFPALDNVHCQRAFEELIAAGYVVSGSAGFISDNGLEFINAVNSLTMPILESAA